ncbi:MAG: hypothetical protein U0935_21245 [Pirellulales bacterium]
MALKVLPLHLTSDLETVRRFEREMRAVGKVEHLNVVRVMRSLKRQLHIGRLTTRVFQEPGDQWR